MIGWGADGCRGGWVFCSASDENSVQFYFYPNFSEFFEHHEADLLFVDTPIGLSSKGRRECDILLKSELGKKQSSVFMAPVRDAVWAKDYKTACEINQNATGKKISIQSWNICPPIREVDTFLRLHPQKLSQIKESHPEFLFKLFSGEPLLSKKKTLLGYEERVRIVERMNLFVQGAISSFLVETKRKNVQLDDIVDALVLAVSSLLCQQNDITSLPSIPQKDVCGIEMGIFYPKKKVTQQLV